MRSEYFRAWDEREIGRERERGTEREGQRERERMREREIRFEKMDSKIKNIIIRDIQSSQNSIF